MSTVIEPAFEFRGKVAFVTGAASGMGRATAELLAKRGADVAMVDLRTAEVEQAAKEVTEAYGFGSLDIAFNAAGLPGRIGEGYLLADYPVEEWRRMIQVNCDGVLFCNKAQISFFMESGIKGAIVNVASTASERVFPYCSAYVTAKHAVQGITRSAGVEYGRFGIRTNAIAPGYTNTRMMDQAPEYTRELARRSTPLDRMGTPEEIAEFAVFLLSEKASFINGAYLPIDGGFLGAKPGWFPWDLQ